MNRLEDRLGSRAMTVAVVVTVLLIAGVGVAVGGGIDTGSLADESDTESLADGPVSEEIASERAVLDGSHAIEPRPDTPFDVDDDTILVRHELSTNDEPGTVDVTTEARLPDRVTGLRLTPLSATDDAIEADGFDRETTDDGGEEWVWDGETTRPSLTYTMDGNETEEREGPLAGEGAYRFVDVGDWAIVRPPRASIAWSFTGGPGGSVSVERENSVAGDGVASQALAVLGPYEEHVHEAADQRFRLIVPDAADPEPSPGAVFEAFEGASTALQVGARDDEVFAVAAPTESVSWAPRGLQIGDADLWVRDTEPAGTADDVWTHEYVHTRQSYRAERSARWFTEATATYYAALFALERGAADFEAFERTLSAGERDPYAGSVLANPDAWAANADYVKGALVAGEIDRRIRVATDGRASLATVFREFNDAPVDPDDRDTWVTNDDFLDAVEDAAAEGGDDAVATEIREEAERLTTTDATPEFWGRETHAEAFGETPAQVGYGIDDEGVRAVGEYRDRAIERDPVRLVDGERLALAVRVSNTGGTAGSYEVSIRVDGETVTTRSGSVEAGAETVERLEHEFTDAGEYEVRVGSETLDVVVSEPGSVSVRDVATDAADVAAGESVRVTTTVGTDAGIPADGPIEFLVNGEPVGTDPVKLDADAETTVERDVVLETVGTATITVVGPENEASVSVSVGESDGTDDSVGGGADSDDDVAVSVPGFGLVVAVVALLSAVGLFARRR
ncbi:PGF-CTERM protein [Halorubrum alkaliphilum]|uniref:PGF-CTERM protein n=1 Tax=Halorubrum alkaliphilum TaxID=261290 RepID=A0A8T4GAE5_9EURY|nr:PGF-CTERM sorting domain-containing protein [Halorubrum alkaliphilum]MBP1921063.1 PGF-CTERM protein [Halorubrum alkaliphilum]